MKIPIVIIMFCLLSTLAFAQNWTSDHWQIIKLQQKLVNQNHHKVDSLQLDFFHRSNHLVHLYHDSLARLDTIHSQLRTKADNIAANQLLVKKYLNIHRADSLQTEWKMQTDNLAVLNAYSENVWAMIDSVKALREKTFVDLNTKFSY